MTYTLLERSYLPAYTWLLTMGYVFLLLNLILCGIVTPSQYLHGSTPDISTLLRFCWYQPVYYKVDDSNFPSDIREEREHFVGIAENVEHAMTFKRLMNNTKTIINRSNIKCTGLPL